MNRGTIATALAGTLVALIVGGVFLTLDKTLAHWYTPEPIEPLTLDEVAAAILGDWDRSQSLEAPEVTGKISEAGPGSMAQLRVAIDRLANVAALAHEGQDQRRSDQALVNWLQGCEAFLLGRNAVASACNLFPIGQ